MSRTTATVRDLVVASLDGVTHVSVALMRARGVSDDPPRARPKILVVRLDEIGDFVLTLPFLHALRASSPNAEIILVAKPVVASLARTRADLLDRVVAFDVPGYRDCRSLRTLVPKSLRFVGPAVRFVRAHPDLVDADIAYLPRWGPDVHRAAELVAMLRSRSCVGLKGDGGPCHARRRRWLTRTVEGGVGLHESRRPLLLLEDDATAPIDRPRWPGASERVRASSTMRTVAIGPGAGSRRREWPPSRYAAVIDALAREHAIQVQIVGGPDDRALASAIASMSEVPVESRCGVSSLSELPAALSECDLFIGADSGLAHLADAVGAPTVVVSCHPQGGDVEHDNAPERFAPTYGPTRVVQPVSPSDDACAAGCRQATAHCILRVEVTSVVAAARDILRR